LQTGRDRNWIKVNFDSKNNKLSFKIIGSKLNYQQKRGIRIREVTVKITDKNLQYYKPIIDIFEKNPQAYDLKIKTESAKAFSGYITKISKKLWPRKKYHASAYSFRHAKATELKNSDFDAEEIAKIMGHASSDLNKVTVERKEAKVDLTTLQMSKQVKPRGGDRLLRFKIKNKNEAAKKIKAASPYGYSKSTSRSFSKTLRSYTACCGFEGLARPARTVFIAKSSILRSRAPESGNWDGFPDGFWFSIAKPSYHNADKNFTQS
jgi:hypothetical protein